MYLVSRTSFTHYFLALPTILACLYSQAGYAASQMCQDVKRVYEANINTCNRLDRTPPGQMDGQQMGFARWCANQRGFLQVCKKESTALQYGNLYDAGNNVIGSFMHVHGENGKPRYILSKPLLNDGISVITADPLRKGTVPVPYCGYPAYEYGYVETIYYSDNRKVINSRGTLYLSAEPNNAGTVFKGFLMPYEAGGAYLPRSSAQSHCSNTNVHMTFEKKGGKKEGVCEGGYNPYGCR